MRARAARSFSPPPTPPQPVPPPSDMPRRTAPYAQAVYDTFSELSLLNDVLRIAGTAPPHIAHLAGTLQQIISAFEALRVFSDYHTPTSIRAFIRLDIFIMTLLLVPFFAHLARESHHNKWIVYVAAFAVPLQFMLLLNIQKGACPVSCPGHG